MPCRVPVVFIVFNRLEQTARVFAAIAAARPERLFVIADGARADRDGEAERVAAVRTVVERIDWPCRVERNYAATNLGARQRIVSGLDWVFEHVDQAIILEDDCLPAPAFFDFCADLLERYRDDRRVFSIAGSNFAREDAVPAHYFSRFSLMWGWATWADRWQAYVADPKDVDAVVARTWPNRPLARAHWRKVMASVNNLDRSVWDYQWILTLWRHDALCCRPTVNLVENIGFGADATHTTVATSRVANLPVYNGESGFAQPLSAVAADALRDAVDEREWALIGWRSLVVMYLPALYRLWARHR